MIIESALICLALTVYHEARNDGPNSMIAVAELTLTRSKNENKSVCEVITTPKQFGWVNQLGYKKPSKTIKLTEKLRPKEKKAWEESKRIAANGLKGNLPGIVRNATHFYNTKTDNPKWRHKMVYVKTVGSHSYYRDRKTKSS